MTQIRGVHEVNDKIAQDAKYEALAKQVNILVSERSERASSSPRQVMNYESCGGGHNVMQCSILVSEVAPIEHVDYVNQEQKFQENPYGGTYNLRWRNHPNFHWGNQNQ